MAKWRRWVEEAIRESKEKGIYSILITKADRRLIVYKNGNPYKTYTVGIGRNGSMDKHYAGDGATPEGRYKIIRKNPKSSYYKALLINYPNDEDKRKFQETKRNGLLSGTAGIGGLIEIHGGGNEGQRTILRTTVSCGSGSILTDPSGMKKWIFETPRGEFSVQSKHVKPNWIRPDWAFIEEGEAIPKSKSDRVEESVLGDYALGIGNGYFIHGTLYTRLLGRNVTHGCIRVGDRDLKALYEKVPLGAKVLIF